LKNKKGEKIFLNGERISSCKECWKRDMCVGWGEKKKKIKKKKKEGKMKEEEKGLESTEARLHFHSGKLLYQGHIRHTQDCFFKKEKESEE
jgi:hypothetical protein